jgi:hypothetical protein
LLREASLPARFAELGLVAFVGRSTMRAHVQTLMPSRIKPRGGDYFIAQLLFVRYHIVID